MSECCRKNKVCIVIKFVCYNGTDKLHEPALIEDTALIGFKSNMASIPILNI